MEEAVKLINGRDKPLALYVFSGRDKVADMFKLHTSSGGLCINDTIMHLGVEELPFGGVGASGMGAYHGKHGFDTFTHYKVGELCKEYLISLFNLSMSHAARKNQLCLR